MCEVRWLLLGGAKLAGAGATGQSLLGKTAAGVATSLANTVDGDCCVGGCVVAVLLLSQMQKADFGG